MKFATARRELAKLAKGQCYVLKYDLMVHEDGQEWPTCWVYIDGGKHHTAPTWRKALNLLKVSLEPRRKKARKGEAPTGETRSRTKKAKVE